jgi:hypothetical protein
MSEPSFHERLQSHRGGLVRVSRRGPVVWGSKKVSSKIGLLMSVTAGAGWDGREGAQWVELLIDGSVRSLFLYPDEIELIGADDE